MELALWLVFGSAMFYSMVILPIIKPEQFVHHIGDYLIFMVLMGYLRNVRYLDFPRRGMGFVKRFGMFLLAPAYGVIQLTLLTPLRFYALFTLHKGSWGTRQGGVEVSVAGDHESEVTEIFEEEDPYSDKKVTETLQLMRLEGVALRTRPRPSGGIPAQPQPIPGYDEEQHAAVPQQRVSWGTPEPAGQQQWQGGYDGYPDPYQQQYPGQGHDPRQGGYPHPDPSWQQGPGQGQGYGQGGGW
jgi:hyaluronan synthase